MVTQRVVFFPPPKAYAFESDEVVNSQNDIELSQVNHTMWIMDEAGKRIRTRDVPDFHAYKIPTRNGETIAAFFCKKQNAKFTLLVSHGNATDIGYTRDGLVDLAHALNVNLFAYDYSGYGLSTGEPTVSNVLADVEAAYDFLVQHLHIEPTRIIAYGQSLGGGATMHLAEKCELAGIVLHSTFQSGLRVIRRNIESTHFFDIFPNIDIIPLVTSPIFIIHGTHDTEIPVDHGVKLYEASKKLYEPFFCDGAGHNDIEVNFRGDYIKRLRGFLSFLEKDRKIS